MSADEIDEDTYLIDKADGYRGNSKCKVLVRCPICHARIHDEIELKTDHEITDEHIATHEPDDLDLDGPYYYTPMADILIELYGLNKRE